MGNRSPIAPKKLSPTPCWRTFSESQAVGKCPLRNPATMPFPTTFGPGLDSGWILEASAASTKAKGESKPFGALSPS